MRILEDDLYKCVCVCVFVSSSTSTLDYLFQNIPKCCMALFPGLFDHSGKGVAFNVLDCIRFSNMLTVASMFV